MPPPVSLTRFLMALTLGSNQSPNNYIWHILPIKTQKTSSNCTRQRIIMIAIILAGEKICSHQEYYLLFIKTLATFFLQNLDKVLYHGALRVCNLTVFTATCPAIKWRGRLRVAGGSGCSSKLSSNPGWCVIELMTARYGLGQTHKWNDSQDNKIQRNSFPSITVGPWLSRIYILYNVQGISYSHKIDLISN